MVGVKMVLTKQKTNRRKYAKTENEQTVIVFFFRFGGKEQI